MKTISINGVIGWDVLGSDVKKQLDEAKGENVRLEIASPGGFVYDGIEIFNHIKNYEGPTETHIIGLAASAASYIALAADKVTAEENSVFMIHNAWNFVLGDHNELRDYADYLESLSNLLAKTYAKKTGKDAAEIKTLMDETTYFFGEEIEEAGFADEILDMEKPKEDKDDSILNAMVRVETCLSLVKEKTKKEDIEKAAALIGGKPKNKKAPEALGGNKIRRKGTMTAKDLKQENPALYDEIFKEGAVDERKRVSAHLTMGEASKNLEFATTCIKNGSMVTDQEVFAQYQASRLRADDIDARKEDDEATEEVKPKQEVTAESQLTDDLIFGFSKHEKKEVK